MHQSPPEMFDWIQFRASQGHSQSGPEAPPLISRLCASGHWQVFIQDISVHRCIHLSLYPLGSWSPPPAPTAQLRWPASSRKSPAGYKLLPLTDKGGLRAHRDLHSSRNCFVPFPRFMPPDNPVSEVYRELL